MHKNRDYENKTSVFKIIKSLDFLENSIGSIAFILMAIRAAGYIPYIEHRKENLSSVAMENLW